MTGAVSDSSWRGALSNVRFHASVNPGCCMLSSEMRGSVRIDAVRSASPPLVVHTGPPRPCAKPAAGAANVTAATQASTRPLIFSPCGTRPHAPARPKSFLPQRLVNRPLRERCHDAVPRVVRQQAIDRQVLPERASVGQRRIIIEIDGAGRRRVALHPCIHV